MKKTIIFLMCMLALSGCAVPGELTNNDVTVTSAETIVIPTEKVSEVTTGAPVTVTESETEIIEEIDPRYKQVSIRSVEMNYFAQYPVVSNGYIICSAFDDNNADYEKRTSRITFINAETGENEGWVLMPDKNRVTEIIRGSGDVLCRLVLEKTEPGDYSTLGHTPNTITVASVNKDFTYDISDYTMENAFIDHHGCRIAEWDNALVNAEDGSVLVEGYTKEGDTYGMYSRWQMYMFPIDSARFVYRTGGYECMPGFGVYDFRSETALQLAGSEDAMPIGYSDGRIYYVKTSWDGFGTDIYTMDIETQESEHFAALPFELEGYAMPEFFMRQSDGAVFILRNWSLGAGDVNYPAVLYRLDPETAEVVAIYEIPEEYHTNGGLLVSDNIFGMIGDDELLLMDIE